MKKQTTLRSLLLIAAACSVTFLSSCTKENTENKEADSNRLAEERNDEKFQSTETKKDADFVAHAVEVNYAEVKLAQLAQEKSSNDKVIALAKSLEESHKKTLDQLKGLAEKKVISIPAEESDEAKDKIKALSEKDVKEFNKDWTDKLIEKHKNAIEDYEAALKNDKFDSDVKEWVGKTLPHLREHLDKLITLSHDLN